MKIAFMVGSLAGGGAERVVAELCSQFVCRQHEVYVLLIASNRQSYDVDERVRVVDCSRVYSVKGIGFLNRVRMIRREISRIQPDVCVSFTVAVNIYAVMGCKGLPVKLVLAERNDPHIDPPGKISRLMRRVLYPFADGYVFQTNEEREFFGKRIQKKGAVIPNPVNPQLPEPCTAERSKRIVTAVRLVPQKNIKMAICAFAEVHRRHPDFRFEIYGDGPLRAELQRQIDDLRLGDAVFLLGNSKSIYTDIGDAYAFVLSSDYEGMSNSMLEAMALGIPTISTDYPSGGARAVISDGVNGLLVPTNDVKALAEKLGWLIEHAAAAMEIGRAGIAIRTDLCVERIAEKWENYLLSLCVN